jgi:phage-related protein
LINYLEILGPGLPSPHSKYINHGIYELRIKGKQEVRIFYCFQQKMIYLLHGFVKKSNHTPEKELSTAIKRQQTL